MKNKSEKLFFSKKKGQYKIIKPVLYGKEYNYSNQVKLPKQNFMVISGENLEIKIKKQGIKVYS